MKKITKQQQDQINFLTNLTDDEIDTSDIPEIIDWTGAERGKFYRPLKKQVTLRLDADMLQWFREQDGKYQPHINQALREYMEAHREAS